jgi:predicted phosphoribosyltransferase
MYHDREDAGRQLAQEFGGIVLRQPVVLGIPRGGVATAAALASELSAELDVVLARKLRAPFQPELAIGALGEDGSLYLAPHANQIEGVDDFYIAQERERQKGEIRRRKELFRKVRPAVPLTGRTVIVTDDGVATGATMFAALQVVRAQGPHELIVAVPVAPPSQIGPLMSHCDRLICLESPEDFWAVGQFYEDFQPVEDDEVVALLRKFAPSQPSTARAAK